MRTTDAPAIGARIRQLRKRRGLSLKALAQRVGTSATALHRYETGWDRFEVRTLRRIAAALDAELEVRLRAARPAAGFPDPKRLLRLISPLFWERKLSATDFAEHRRWVLARVLMYGNLDQVRSVRRFYGDDAIRQAVAQRGIDPRTRNYWTLFLGAPDASQGPERKRLEHRP